MLPDGFDFLLNRNSGVIIVWPTSHTHAFKHTRRGYELKLRVMYAFGIQNITLSLYCPRTQPQNNSVRVLVLSLRHSSKCTDTHESRDRWTVPKTNIMTMKLLQIMLIMLKTCSSCSCIRN